MAILYPMSQEIKFEAALGIVKRLIENGCQAVFAGGYVRDMLLGLHGTGDIDIATDATPQTVAALFSRVQPVGEHFGVMLVIERGVPFEVATFRSDVGTIDGRHPREVVFSTAREDAQRRDFTINGLFFDPTKNTVLDYVDGEKDLRKALVRAIGDPEARFKEDYLRLVRAVRFAARFGFEIEAATWEAMKEHAGGIRHIAQERIFQELNKMLTGPHPDRALELLSASSLLALVLPEVETLKGVEQPAEFHPEGDVFTHTVKALSLLEHPSAIAAWSTLLHDIGKPSTMTRRDRVRFNNHHRVGARLARRALERLRASRALIDGVYECIDKHMDFMNVASHGNLDNYDFLRSRRGELADEQVRPAPLLTGKDLISMGFIPGPVFGRILDELYDLQLEEKLHTAEEAREWVEANRTRLCS